MEGSRHGRGDSESRGRTAGEAYRLLAEAGARLEADEVAGELERMGAAVDHDEQGRTA